MMSKKSLQQQQYEYYERKNWEDKAFGWFMLLVVVGPMVAFGLFILWLANL